MTTLLTQITAALTKVALSYHRMSGLYFLAVIFATTILTVSDLNFNGNDSLLYVMYNV